VPYRIDLHNVDDAAFDRLVELGAIDVESSPGGGGAALMPDSVTPEKIANALGVAGVSVSPASGRDAGSVWVLNLRPVRSGRLRIVPADAAAEPDALGLIDLRLIDASAFGTGLHPTTALCLEALEEAMRAGHPDSVLDVGTGSGVLALGALLLGGPRALGIDLDEDALRVAAENARINGVGDRLRLTRGGPGTVTGTWPLVLANILAGPLIEMAPALVRRVGHHGHLVLSGIPASVEPDVDRAYRRLGLRRLGAKSRAGWVVLVLQAPW
jgi:ribosomal protein L11 methyltransferase